MGNHFAPLLVLAAVATLLVAVLLLLVIRERHRREVASILAEERGRRYRSLFDSSLAGIALVSGDGVLKEWNARLPAILEATGRPDEDGAVRRPAWREESRKLARLARTRAPGEELETSIIAGDGSRKWVTLRHWPMAGTQGGDYWLLVNDVTRRQEARSVLRLAQQVYRSMSEAILVTDVATRVVDVNPAFERITGYVRDEAIGVRAALIRSSRHDNAFFDAMWRALNAEGHWAGEIWNKRRDGAEIPCWMHIDAVSDPQSGELTHYVGVFSDISERKSVEERIHYLAHHDQLTGLANRFALDAVLPQTIALARRNGRRVALLFTDLDFFKEINDTLGHVAGDQVLIEVAQRLRQVARDSDFLARFGGDEFVIVLSEVEDSDDAMRVATAIIETLHRPIVVDGREILVTPSIGISLFPEHADAPEILLGMADSAMYRAKSDGRNGYCVHTPPAD
ncbi:MAG: diguanylate cyclase [Rhodocyclales bacterium]|nr:diguanylate cyclase [Rhodocyclales bacterium]